MLTNFELLNLANTLAIMDRQELFKLASMMKSQYPGTAASLENALYVADMEYRYSEQEEPA